MKIVIVFIAWLIFIGWLMVTFSPWWGLLILAININDNDNDKKED